MDAAGYWLHPLQGNVKGYVAGVVSGAPQCVIGQRPEQVEDDGLVLHGGISSVPGNRYDITHLAKERRAAGAHHDQ